MSSAPTGSTSHLKNISVEMTAKREHNLPVEYVRKAAPMSPAGRRHLLTVVVARPAASATAPTTSDFSSDAVSAIIGILVGTLSVVCATRIRENILTYARRRDIGRGSVTRRESRGRRSDAALHVSGRLRFAENTYRVGEPAETEEATESRLTGAGAETGGGLHLWLAKSLRSEFYSRRGFRDA